MIPEYQMALITSGCVPSMQADPKNLNTVLIRHTSINGPVVGLTVRAPP